VKEKLDLRTCLAIVRENKRKFHGRGFSGTTMADRTFPYQKVGAIKVTKSGQTSDHAVHEGVQDQHEKIALFSESVQVDPPLLRFLVGKGGIMKEKIETQTGARMRIPSAQESNQKKPVVVEASSEESLNMAVTQIQEVLDEAIRSPSFQYSHFISIPLALHPPLLESVTGFQESVLESVRSSSDDSCTTDKGIDKSIFVKPTTFHLTLLMLKLWNEDRVHAAINCLQRTMPHVHEALGNSPLSIKLTGVDCMQGNPAKAHVLYADVEANDQAERLLSATQVITEAFTEAGLVMDKDKEQAVKLHATLMNTTQRGGSTGGKRRRFPRRIPFDGTEIMAKYQSYQWGEYRVSEAHLSQRFVYDENGYYHCCTSIPFP